MRTSAAQRKRLVDENVSYVRSIAAKVKEQLPHTIEFDDLVGYGMTGLIEAAERFDGNHGAAFTTFAYYRVRGAIYDGLRGMGWLPRGEYQRLRFEERAGEMLGHLAEREAAQGAYDAVTAGDLDDEVREIADALGNIAAVFVAGREGQAEANVEPADHSLEVDQEGRRAARAVATLPEKERRLIQMCYFEDRSLVDASRALGLSKSWGSRLHARAIELLRQALEKDG